MKSIKFLLAVFVITILSSNSFGGNYTWLSKRSIKKVEKIFFLETYTVTPSVLAPPKYPDGVYTKENTRTRVAIPYTSLREADVMWSKRVWRVIDLKQKMNQPLYYPATVINDRKCLFDVIKDAALKGIGGHLSCFDASDDEFRMELTNSEVEKALFTTQQKLIPNAVTGALDTTNVVDPVSVTKYSLKEDWFFDKQRSVLDVRIIGIQILKAKVDQTTGAVVGDAGLFWIYFPEARPIFANQEVYMRHNDAERRTLEDIFWKRMFASYVTKESNVFDRVISEYTTGLNAQLEAERVKDDIFKFEHDLWHF